MVTALGNLARHANATFSPLSGLLIQHEKLLVLDI